MKSSPRSSYLMRRAGASRRRASRGFTMIELGVAVGLFIVVAGLVSVVIASSVSTQVQQRSQAGIYQTLSDLASAVAQMPYTGTTSLLADDFNVPALTTGVAPGSGCSGTSTVRVLDVSYLVSYTCTSSSVLDALGSPSAIQITAATTYNGQSVSRAAVADEPSIGLGTMDLSPGTAANVATLGIRVNTAYASTWEATSFTSSPLHYLIYLQASGGHTFAAPYSGSFAWSTQSAPDANGDLFISVPLGATQTVCTAANPCTLALTTSSTAPDSYTNAGQTIILTGAGTTAPLGNVVLSPASTTWASADVSLAGSETVTLAATNPGGGATTAGTNHLVTSSICLWGTFNDGPVSYSEPFCNSSSASTITISTFTVGSDTIPVPVGAPITLSTDSPSGSCPSVGQLGWVYSAAATASWVAEPVCTSWTWGYATSWTTGGTTTVPFDGTVISLTPGAVGTGTTTWGATTGTIPSGSCSSDTTSPTATLVGICAADEPATGFDTNTTWSEPRFDGSASGTFGTTGSCYASSTCTEPANIDYEAMRCAAGAAKCAATTGAAS